MLCPLQHCSLKSVEADESLKTISVPFCTASMPTHSVSRGAYFGPHSPSDGLPCSDHSCASLSLHLHMPSVRASRSGDQGLPEPFHGDSGGSVSSPLHADQAALSAQGSNTSGFAVVASSALPASLTLTVLLVGAGVTFTSNKAPFGSIASMATHVADTDWHAAFTGCLCIP